MKWKHYGESSLTLLSVHIGLDKDKPAVPSDPSDFNRCIHLFECLNLNDIQINNLLYMTAGKYPIWIKFAENWNTLVELYNEEISQGTAPKLFSALEKLSMGQSL